MIKQGLKNFAKNLKYFFTPLGVMTLGAIIGFSILLPGIISSIENLAREVQKILAETNIDFVKLKDQLFVEVKALDWGNPVSAATIMLSNEWINKTLNVCIGSLVDGSEVYVSQLTGAVDAFSAQLLGYIIGFVIFVALGIFVGFLITKWLIRREIAKRTAFKFILISILDAFLTLVFIACVGWLTTIWKPSIYISVVAFIILFGIGSLLEAYLIHGRKKVDANKVINMKNIISLFVVDVIIIAISVAVVGLIIAVLNKIVALFVGLALFEIAIIVMDLNAESYVKSLTEEVETSLPEKTKKSLAKTSTKAK